VSELLQRLLLAPGPAAALAAAVSLFPCGLH